ncbi:bifunctional methylenetetrahydrofolate dehydrogenase/methenyltetrahydrofolate cyclohydrolase FolD [Parvularcula dongshanensis]|uniref:Bifunctional protein FolD n=1 Tax=Parvularcula dongshanensis TaxID=1173995 RepID=A0A840I466_9PROT|nr:bifunctional methylenetetrahydrofolate dehydrogenase/methenyltetrahydrofolate cyclohydrolase FolD [Parvularcula dongshanensis]MBB4659071.1 methylenetetrahydrofolate dehydrogenase (NADP+)/methenyltetrahydrofolate cyclohydrolase [Parvularcula dongshanensis]
MSARLLDGKALGAEVRARAGEAAKTLPGQVGLAVVLVGEDPASQVYVRNKHREAEAAGLLSFVHRLPADTPEADVVALVERLNADEAVDGILVQMPLPEGIDALRVIAAIDPDKDVDGLTETNAGRLLLGRRGLVPCTPQGSMLLAGLALPDLTGKTAVVVGRSILVGKPLALLLQAANATVTMAHSRTKDLGAVCRTADVLCAAVGRPGLLTAEHVKPGAVVIDVGINRVDAPEKGEGKTKLVGDVAPEAAEVAGWMTPVPGGVGPMTIACLLRNTVLAAARRRGLEDPRGL